MRKPLISLALVAAQALTWATGSLYACFSADGSACIDRGPQFCDCCHDSQDEHASHDADRAQSCGDHGVQSERTELVQSCSMAPCGCQHQAMGDAQKATTPGAKVAIDHSLRFPAAWVCVVVATPISSHRAQFTMAISADAASERLSSLTTVVLRC